MHLPAVLRAKRYFSLTEEDAEKYDLFLNQLAADKNMNVPSVLKKRQVDSEMSKEDLEKIDMFIKQLSAGRNNVFPRLLDRKRREVVERKSLVNEVQKEKEESHSDHDSHAEENVAHSTIGITLVLGFIFMMFVDQIGGKFSHRPHQSALLITCLFVNPFVIFGFLISFRCASSPQQDHIHNHTWPCGALGC